MGQKLEAQMEKGSLKYFVSVYSHLSHVDQAVSLKTTNSIQKQPQAIVYFSGLCEWVKCLLHLGSIQPDVEMVFQQNCKSHWFVFG